MGIDIYTYWANQTAKQKEAQITGFSVEAGNVGYLREAYHGEPYATMVLLEECFLDSQPKGGVPIPAKTLRERLPEVLKTAIERQAKVYNEGADHEDTKAILKSYEEFVALAEKMEKKTGKPCKFYASY